MAGKIDSQYLAQHWVHSHEEDSDKEMVFRPATFKFPPSRGRSSFDLKPDGSLAESGPGPADRTQSTAGKWRLEGDRNLVLQSSAPGESRVLQIASADRNRLVIKK